MSNIQFEENQIVVNRNFYQSAEEKGMVGFLIKKGIAKDAKTANIILVIFACILFVITFFIMKSNSPTRLNQEQIKQTQNDFEKRVRTNFQEEI